MYLGGKRMLIKNKIISWKVKGQYTLYALFMTVLTIICYTQVYPILKTFIDGVLPETDDATGTLLTLSPLVIFFFILYGAMWYVIPSREERP